ncbi:putative serine/threonine-protein kinase PBL1 [Bidens hawaiensis]|uniref:putative serine/threonine-protein kinase PBL1 n=1 Tax=Bidens hawaiensis TaxID=980011 RepID=UPI004049E9C1
MVDSNIKGTISPTCLRRFTQIADRCVHSVPRERPTMTKVVALLQALLELQESPGVMGFSWKIHKYFVLPNEREFNQSATSNINRHEELVTIGVKLFAYDELKLATRDFGNETCLGEGRYGKAYKGWVDNTELPIVVKKLCHRTHLDLEVTKNFLHPNLAKLIGYCLEGEQLYLVYEFMHKGNLEDLLQSGAVARLPLITKVEIVVGIARGIVFLKDTLSNRTWPRVSESPLYRHKILLDEDFTPKLSGYDITLLVDGQYNIANPDYDGMGLVPESNLSGYELVFMEVLTGEQIHNSNRAQWIDLLFRKCGKVSLRRIAQLCFKICNEVDSKYKMLRMLKEHNVLIQRRLKSWLLDPHC